jgi:hypothetical protein
VNNPDDPLPLQSVSVIKLHQRRNSCRSTILWEFCSLTWMSACCCSLLFRYASCRLALRLGDQGPLLSDKTLILILLIGILRRMS